MFLSIFYQIDLSTQQHEYNQQWQRFINQRFLSKFYQLFSVIPTFMYSSVLLVYSSSDDSSSDSSSASSSDSSSDSSSGSGSGSGVGSFGVLEVARPARLDALLEERESVGSAEATATADLALHISFAETLDVADGGLLFLRL